MSAEWQEMNLFFSDYFHSKFKEGSLILRHLPLPIYDHFPLCPRVRDKSGFLAWWDQETHSCIFACIYVPRQ